MAGESSLSSFLQWYGWDGKVGSAGLRGRVEAEPFPSLPFAPSPRSPAQIARKGSRSAEIINLVQIEITKVIDVLKGEGLGAAGKLELLPLRFIE